MDGTGRSRPDRRNGYGRQAAGEETRKPVNVAEENEEILPRGVGRRTSLRHQSDSIAVPTVHLGPAAACRGYVHHVPDPEPHQLLPVETGQRQFADSARRRNQISDCHRLQ